MTEHRIKQNKAGDKMSENNKTYLRKQQVTQIKADKTAVLTDVGDTSKSLLEDTRSELLRNTEAGRKEKSKRYSVNNSTEFEIHKGNLVITTFVGDYEQKIELTSFLDRLRNRVMSSEYYKINVDNIRTLLRNCFSDLDLKVSCTCADWKFRLAYRASEEGYIYGEKEIRPAEKTNPKDTKGSLCKHLIRVLSNYSWLSFLSGVVYRYLKNHVDELAKAFGIPELKDYFARDYNKKQQPLKEPQGDEDVVEESEELKKDADTEAESEAEDDKTPADSKESAVTSSASDSKRDRRKDKDEESEDSEEDK